MWCRLNCILCIDYVSWHSQRIITNNSPSIHLSHASFVFGLKISNEIVQNTSSPHARIPSKPMKNRTRVTAARTKKEKNFLSNEPRIGDALRLAIVPFHRSPNTTLSLSIIWFVTTWAPFFIHDDDRDSDKDFLRHASQWIHVRDGQRENHFFRLRHSVM